MSSRIEDFFSKHVFMTNGTNEKTKNHLEPLDEAKEILRAAFKRNSTNGTPNGIVGWNIGKLLVSLLDATPSDIKEAISIAQKDGFGAEVENIKRVVQILAKMNPRH